MPMLTSLFQIVGLLGTLFDLNSDSCLHDGPW